jgi:hypothetical protein
MLVPYMAQKRLDVMCYWVNRCHRLQESIHADEFTPMAAEAFAKLMAFESQEEDATTVKAPSDFKAGSKWKPFKEGVIAYLNSIRGRDQVPLAYIIREEEAPDLQAIYENEHQRLIAMTPLQGIEYADDNGKVFDYLKSWTLNKHGSPHYCLHDSALTDISNTFNERDLLQQYIIMSTSTSIHGSFVTPDQLSQSGVSV